ncbi:Vitelline membrane outer layer protein 1 [Anabarilius grahami]|uniref:Vitelline membrane outer layer protein 1 n=1 Tax=Anabarilius grahami TaxID=495550 RepID=A0A3N0YLL9_ANAGA|nr:Vitelline membrane outer layer protein 1 [Anabarilius grahami]
MSNVTKSKRPRYNSEIRRDKVRNKTRICIGDAFERWRRLKTEKNLNTDANVANFLLDSWGEWTDIKWCPAGFLTTFQLRVESFQGSEDDTAANNIRFKCSEGSLLEGGGTSWGTLGDWSRMCEGRGICGIKTRVEEPQGIGDDTALNDVQMYCCD